MFYAVLNNHSCSSNHDRLDNISWWWGERNYQEPLRWNRIWENIIFPSWTCPWNIRELIRHLTPFNSFHHHYVLMMRTTGMRYESCLLHVVLYCNCVTQLLSSDASVICIQSNCIFTVIMRHFLDTICKQINAHRGPDGEMRGFSEQC